MIGEKIGVMGENGGARGDWRGEPTSRSFPRVVVIGGGGAARHEDGILTELVKDLIDNLKNTKIDV